jgi:hypothetical protein
VTVEARRYPPDAPLAGTSLAVLALGVLDEAIGRIGHDPVERRRAPRPQPQEAVAEVVLGRAVDERRPG